MSIAPCSSFSHPGSWLYSFSVMSQRYTRYSRYHPTPVCLVDIVRSTHLGMENDSRECVACQATTTKCHKLGLNNRNLFCYNSGVLGKDLTGPEASFHLHLATFSLYSHLCSVLCVHSYPYKKQIKLNQDLSSKLHLIADIFLLKTLSSNTIMFILKPGSRHNTAPNKKVRLLGTNSGCTNYCSGSSTDF